MPAVWTHWQSRLPPPGAGEHTAACIYADQAAAVAEQEANMGLAARIRERRQLFENQQPYRE